MTKYRLNGRFITQDEAINALTEDSSTKIEIVEDKPKGSSQVKKVPKDKEGLEDYIGTLTPAEYRLYSNGLLRICQNPEGGFYHIKLIEVSEKTFHYTPVLEQERKTKLVKEYLLNFLITQNFNGVIEGVEGIEVIEVITKMFGTKIKKHTEIVEIEDSRFEKQFFDKSEFLDTLKMLINRKIKYWSDGELMLIRINDKDKFKF